MTDKRKNTVNTPVVGNLAYNLDALVQERNLEEAGRISHEERQVVRRPAAKPRVVARPKVSVPAVCCVVVLAAMTVGVLLGYVQLSNIAHSVDEMQTQLNQLDNEHMALLTKYEQTFDMTTVKEKAEAAGMSKPASGQIEYVDLSNSDSATVYRSGGLSALYSVMNTIKGGWCAVLEYFT